MKRNIAVLTVTAMIGIMALSESWPGTPVHASPAAASTTADPLEASVLEDRSASTAQITPSTSDGAPLGEVSETEGMALIRNNCASCHGIDQVTSASKTATQWTDTIDQMVGYGAQFTPEQRELMIQFLATRYGAN